MYFNLRTKSDIVIAHSIDAKIAKGIMLFAIAYTTHRISPVINAKFHNKDISLVDLVLKALIICGASAIATINPAK